VHRPKHPTASRISQHSSSSHARHGLRAFLRDGPFWPVHRHFPGEEGIFHPAFSKATASLSLQEMTGSTFLIKKMGLDALVLACRYRPGLQDGAGQKYHICSFIRKAGDIY